MLYRRGISPWSSRCSRLQRWLTETTAIGDLPANPTEKERSNSSGSELPLTIACTQRLLLTMRFQRTTARSLGWSPPSNSSTTPATVNGEWWEIEGVWERMVGRRGTRVSWRSSWPIYRAARGQIRKFTVGDGRDVAVPLLLQTNTNRDAIR
jgi:hypothetical protein